jgi:hypothetical protein
MAGERTLDGVDSDWRSPSLLPIDAERRGEEAAGDAHDERSPVHYSIT